MTDLPWRHGKRVPEHIYDANDRPLVTMPSAELAAFVVAAVNGEAGAALSALQERVNQALEELNETRWNCGCGSMKEWAETVEGRTFKRVTRAQELLRGE